MSRREIVRHAVSLALTASSAAGLALQPHSALAADERPAAPPEPVPAEPASPPEIPRQVREQLGIPDGRPQQVAMLVYPQMTALDLIGPQQILAGMGNVDVHLVWKDRSKPVVSDAGVPILPTRMFSECPEELTVLLVPGGTLGTLAVMQDDEVLDFVAEKGRSAEWVTSVCTGSLVLGAAGLLAGYRATSHWAMRDSVLPLFGATPVKARVVVDRNRMTGGGVTAGIDFGLQLAARLRNERMARALQLSAEYDPQPPFDAGTLEGAGKDVAELVEAGFLPLQRMMSEAAAKSRRTP
ncbi:MAG: DJ-1/PfpI family protein [Armatimonadota bacterium]